MFQPEGRGFESRFSRHVGTLDKSLEKFGGAAITAPGDTSPSDATVLIGPLLCTSFPVSTPNSIHHSHLTVCLRDSLNLTRCPPILFWTSACEKAGSRDFAFVGAVEISSLRLRFTMRRAPDYLRALRRVRSVVQRRQEKLYARAVMFLSREFRLTT